MGYNDAERDSRARSSGDFDGGPVIVEWKEDLTLEQESYWWERMG